jgi:hypothetical protein
MAVLTYRICVRYSDMFVGISVLRTNADAVSGVEDELWCWTSWKQDRIVARNGDFLHQVKCQLPVIFLEVS